MLAKFFRFAFGVAGDKTAIPDTTQVSGAVSYQQAYGPQYELPYTDPNARDVERAQNNQLHYDITTALQEYQTNATPDWIDPSQNGAANYAYPFGARVRYSDGNIYSSIAAANNALPTDPTKWVPIGNGLLAKGISVADVTLTVAESAKPIIVLTGALTANRTLNIPAYQQNWLIVNNTTGNFLVAVKTPAGTGISIRNGGFVTQVYSDGVNIYSAAPTTGLNVLKATASGSWVAPAGVFSVTLGGVGGGGGGGGGGGATNSLGVGGGGAGGGPAAYEVDRVVAVIPGTSYPYVVGVGGTSGTAGSPTVPGGAGGNGTATTFNGITISPGGGGSGGVQWSGSGTPSGGTPANGSPNASYGNDGIAGANGGVGNGGMGGSSPFGGGGGSGRAGSTGVNGVDADVTSNYGGGGGGGGGGYGTGGGGASGGRGGRGAPGVIVIKW